MNTAYLIQQIEQLLREQDSIYHNTAVRFGLSDTACPIRPCGSCISSRKLTRC